METVKNIFNWCRRYISIIGIAIVVFLVYTLFLQENSMFRYFEYNRTIDSLRTEISHNCDTLQFYHELNTRLSTDPEMMEKVVREQYNMNRKGEDVYVFE